MFPFRLATLLAILISWSPAVLGGPADPGQEPVSTTGKRTAVYSPVVPYTAPPVSPKLDPALRRLVARQPAIGAMSVMELADTSEIRIEVVEDGRVLVPCLIRSNDPAKTVQQIEAIGGLHRVTAGEIVVAVVRREEIEVVAGWPEVVSMAASYLRKALLNVSRPSTGVDQVYTGSGLPSPFTGKGVVVGVVDTGIDYRHPDFKTANGTRILSIWDVAGVPAGGQPRTCGSSAIDANTCPEVDMHGHGTHVAGTAAGNGRQLQGYYGMAPEADLVVANADRSTTGAGRFDDATVIDACQYIFQQAAAAGRPAVINLSLGGLGGPLDGTSEWETALSALTGPGRIIVASAGNDGGKPLHLGYSASGASYETSNETELEPVNREQWTEISLWYSTGSLMTGIALYTSSLEQLLATPPVGPGGATGLQSLFSPTGIKVADWEIDARTTSDPGNGSRYVVVRLRPTLEGIVLGARFSLYIWGSGSLDAWISNGRFGTKTGSYWKQGDDWKTVGAPATAKKVIAVGNHTTKVQWTDVDGNAVNMTGYGFAVGTISPDSSRGPTRDGRFKPELTAPGSWIAAPLSYEALPSWRAAERRFQILPGEWYLCIEGTSMAAPHVTGLVALMLQANPNLDYNGVLAALQSTATKDALTGASPNPNVWGAGKLNAYAAMKAVAGSVPPPDFIMQVSPSSVTASSSTAGTATVSCIPYNGFNSTVTLSGTGVPSGATATFSQPTIQCGSTTSILTFTAGAAVSGSYTMTVSGAGGGLTRSAALSLTIQAAPVAAPALFVPVILKSSGANNSYYTSEMTFTNRSSQTATLRFSYTAAAGGGTGTGTATLAAGRQLIVPDAIDYLRERGVPIPADGNRVGTLKVAFEGVSNVGDVSVTVRTTTPVPTTAPTGAAGLAYIGVPAAKLPTGPVILAGLRRNSLDRSNIAIQNAGDSGAGNVGIRISLISGVPPNGSVVAVEDSDLSPGGFKQISAPDNFVGWARVERTSGTAPWYAYAVINDNFNSDGSFILPLPEATLGGTSGVTLPVALEASVYSTEAVFANLTDQSRRVNLNFYADALGATPASVYIEMPARAQYVFPNIIDAMRSAGINIPSGVVGPIFVTTAAGSTQGLFVGARTGNPGGGGRYSLFYSAVPFGAASTTTAWISALQQTSTSRSNLALVNTGEVDTSSSTFRIEIYSGDTGAKVGEKNVTVAAKRFLQENAILASVAPGTSNAYARVTKTSGANPFIAYGVINDGGQPGQRSGDGAFVLSE